MKKQLLTIAALALGLGFAQAQTFELKSYEIKLEVNELTGKEDTVEVNDNYSKLNTADSSLVEMINTNYKYYPTFKLDLATKFRIKGAPGTVTVIDGNLIYDSLFFFSPNTTGATNWVTQGYSATTYNGTLPKETTSYLDYAALGIPIPGVVANSKTTYTYPSANVKTRAEYNLLEEMPDDSSISYYDGKKDTATYTFMYDEDLEVFVPSNKNISKYNAKGEEIEEIDFSYNSNTKLYEYASKNELIEVSATLDIDKYYSWTNNAWVLRGFDSTFYDSKGNKTLVKSYSKNTMGNIVYSGRTIVKESLEIIPSSPLPAAPSNLTVVLANARTTETLAATYTLTWKDNSYNETEFEIYRKKAGDSEYSKIGDVDKNVTTYVDKTAVEGEEYLYAVIAVNDNFRSAFSNEVSSKPTGIISDGTNTLKVAVFPNPTTDKWFVTGVSNAKNVTLSTVDGHAIDFAIQADAIDASGLNNGLYILKVEDANGITRTAKVFKK